MCGECIVDSWHLWFCVYTYQKAVVIITWGTEATSGQVMYPAVNDFKHFDARDWSGIRPWVLDTTRLDYRGGCVCVLYYTYTCVAKQWLEVWAGSPRTAP